MFPPQRPQHCIRRLFTDWSGRVGWFRKVSDKNQRPKYYRLPSRGKKQLVAEESKWALLVKAIIGVMKPESSACWWRWWKQWRRREEAIDEEIRMQLAVAIHDRMVRGESAEDAEHGARREFGNELLIKEATREMSGWVAVEQFLQDLRYVFRQMRRSVGFTAVAMITLA